MEKLKATFELDFLPAIGEQAEVTDALKPGGQHMKQETSNEFAGVQRHRTARGVVLSATIEKGNFAIRDGLDAVIGNRHTMCVTSRVFQDGSGEEKGRLAYTTHFLRFREQ